MSEPTDDAPMQEPRAPAAASDEGSTLGPLAHVCGAAIALAAALPLTPDGRSFLAMLRAELERGLLDAVMMLFGFGSPFLFGLAVALVAWPRLRALAIELVRTPLGLVHGQLLLVAFVLWRQGRAIAALPLFAFAVLGAVGYAWSGTGAPGGNRLPLVSTVRWGAMVIAGIAAWCRLQRLAGIELGIAVDVVLGAALVLSWASRPRAASPPSRG
jgi:hypothetical protein